MPHEFLVEACGHRLAAIEQEGSGTPVVFLHGITASVRFWPALFSRFPQYLPDRRAWMSLSLPGHFPSEVPTDFGAKQITSQLFARCVASAVRERCGDRPVHLVGWSTGGFAALATAVHFPELAESVVSLCGFSRGRWRGILGISQHLSRAGPIGRAVLTHTMRNVGKFRWMFHHMLHRMAWKNADHSGDLKPIYDVLAEDYARHDPRTMQTLFSGLRSVSISSQLPAIRCPALLIGGRHDPIVPLCETRHIAERVRIAETHLYSGGHLFFAEHAEAIPDRVRTWMESDVT